MTPIFPAAMESADVVHGVQVDEHVGLAPSIDMAQLAPAQQKLLNVLTLGLEHTGSDRGHAEKASTVERKHIEKAKANYLNARITFLRDCMIAPLR